MLQTQELTLKRDFGHSWVSSLSPRQYFDLAADVLAEHAHLTYKFLTPVGYVIRIEFHSGRLKDNLVGTRGHTVVHLLFYFLFQYIYEFLDALLMSQTTPEEVLRYLKMYF